MNSYREYAIYLSTYLGTYLKEKPSRQVSPPLLPSSEVANLILKKNAGRCFYSSSSKLWSCEPHISETRHHQMEVAEPNVAKKTIQLQKNHLLMRTYVSMQGRYINLLTQCSRRTLSRSILRFGLDTANSLSHSERSFMLWSWHCN